MNVEIARDPKLSKIDHLFVLAAERRDSDLPEGVERIAEDIRARSRFEGRSDETITVLSDSPRKVTLIGLGKEVSIRCMKSALATAAKIAQKQRDRHIAVAISSGLPDTDPETSTKMIASLLAHADYKYETYKTEKKDEKRI